MFENYIAYIKDNPEGYWFKRKIYGWGWTPATWQGWVVIVGYLVVLLYFIGGVDTMLLSQESLMQTISPVIIATIILLTTCFKKGESPRWQWGIEREK